MLPSRWCTPLLFSALLILGSPAFPAEFPIGLFNVVDPADLRKIREAGFNAVQTYLGDPDKLTAFLTESSKLNLMVLAHAAPLLDAGRAAPNGGMIFWYLADEPEVHETPAEKILAHEQAVKKWAEGRQTAVTFGSAKKIEPYAAVGDIWLVDWYPVPHLELDSMGRQVAELRSNPVRGKRPLWAVVQAMNWAEFEPTIPRAVRIGRFPTAAEIRFMTYHAVVEGARGIWYFAFENPQAASLLDAPERWAAVTGTAGELAILRETLAASDGIVPDWAGPELRARIWTKAGEDLLIIVNTGKHAMDLPEALNANRWRPRFVPRRNLDHWPAKNLQIPAGEALILTGTK